MNQQMFARLAVIAAIVGSVIAAIKTDKFNSVLAKFSIKPVPKTLLPWLSLVLGLMLATIDARMQGQTWADALMNGVFGLFSGTVAVAGNETVVEGTKSLLGKGRYQDSDSDKTTLPPTNKE